ncbi:putative protein kinase [Trypanosoma conorhini]|uniref:Protein kinase domain-containing protein n=1 Tax=Trypanosoma conorhini TaxID=83891 RepID=A0A422Q7M3_9TRYP|nr:putative protein kinase [Trypanosoma conorhini]RNF25960.1 putative protein kinase [Trypanosoma conorhini]
MDRRGSGRRRRNLHPGALNLDVPIPVGRPETDLSFFFPLSAHSTIAVSCFCCLCAVVLVAAAVFVNVHHKTVSNDAARATNVCGVIADPSIVNRGRNVLIGASVAFILVYIIVAVAAVWYLRRVSMKLERSMGKTHAAFAHLGKLQLESVPLYVNEFSDVDAITEKQTFLLERYSRALELQQCEDSMNDVSLVLRQFRKLLPDAVFHKESPVELRDVRLGGTAVLRTLGEHSANRLGTLILTGASSLQRRHRLNSLATPNQGAGLAHPTDARNATEAALPRECFRRQAENEISQKTLNISGIHSRFGFRLKARKATVVLISLFGLAGYMDDDMHYCHYLSQQFLSVVTDLIDRHNGTVLNATPDTVIAVWNAFSDNSDHEKAGMQCVCVATQALEPLLTEVVVPMRLDLTLAVVATSGHVLAGTVGSEEECAMVVYGRCVPLAEELPALLVAQGVKYACAGGLPEHCPEAFACIPIDCVTDFDNSRHVVYEIVQKPVPSLQRFTEAFKQFQAGEYDLAERTYLELAGEDCKDAWTLRMGQLCSYLKKSGTMYTRRVPQWQIFPVEEPGDNTVTQRHKLSYHWRKPKVTPVEDQLRSAILRQSDAHASSATVFGEVTQPRLNCRLSGVQTTAKTRPILQETLKQPPVVDVRDRQGMTFRMSSRILGMGIEGSVYMGLSPTGALVAIKAIQLPTMRHLQSNQMSSVNRRRLRRKGINVDVNVDEALDAIVNEVSLLSRLRHTNIVGYISCAVVESKLLLVMEFASGGSLYNMLKRFTKFNVDRAKQYLRDVLKGLAYLHRKDIVHRDIKPQNVLVLETGLCKLSDFGRSQRLLKTSNTSQPEGTAPYMAPEAARGKAEKASDVWSFGIMMAQMLSGILPWPNMDEMIIQAFCYNVGYNESFVPQLDERISAEAKKIIMWCCNREPSKRPTAEELLKCPYFRQPKALTNTPASNRCASRPEERVQFTSLHGVPLKPASPHFPNFPFFGGLGPNSFSASD